MVEAEQSLLKTDMDRLKIENFYKTHQGIDFPKYMSLDARAVKKMQSLIAQKLNIEYYSNGLPIVRQVDALGEVCEGVDAGNKLFSFSRIISLAGLPSPDYVYINWYRYDDIDKLSFDDFDEYFDDLWYPDLDDIDVFDECLTWILSVSHSGQVKVLRI